MKFVRYKTPGEASWGIYVPETGNVFEVAGDLFQEATFGEKIGGIAQLSLLPPCVPGKVVALAYNYRDLIGNTNRPEEPLFFFKSPTSIIGPFAQIIIPKNIQTVWVEVELAFVIKQEARNVSAEKASEYIWGYTIANDVTAQNIYGRDHHLARSKGCDTFCPVGPFLETNIDTEGLTLTTKINDKVTQHSSTSNRLLNDYETLSLISRYITLLPGDIVLTGTPAGAMESNVYPGDVVAISITHLGELTNPVASQ